MKRCVICITVLVLAGAFAACSDNGEGGSLKPNQPPTVWLSAGPPEGSTSMYRIKLFWGGWDPDGDIKRYEYLIADNKTGTFQPSDTVGVPWRPVLRNDSTFTFSADQEADTLNTKKLVATFTRSHTFFIRAVDREGLRSQSPAHRSFTARTLSPDEFPKPIALSQQAFDAAVEAALLELPEPVRRYLSNVAITVEDLPEDQDLIGADPPLSPAILGLFRGAPYGHKASMDPWSHFPSSIVLYQRNLERFARSREDLIEQIGVTLVHEVGHFLGLDEEDLWERGLD